VLIDALTIRPLLQNDIVAKMLDYLDTDTIFFIADQPEKLRAMQITEWGSIVEWCRQTYGLDVRPSDSICVGRLL